MGFDVVPRPTAKMDTDQNLLGLINQSLYQMVAGLSTLTVTGSFSIDTSLLAKEAKQDTQITSSNLIASNQTNKGQFTQITNGTNQVAVVNATPTTEYGLVTRNIPSGTQTVSGTVSVTGVATESTLAAMSAKLPATLGQTTMAASLAVTIASNQSTLSVNNAQVSGTAVSVNAGTLDAGTQRVTIATNQAAISQNLTQLGGVTLATSSGVVGTGVQRITLSQPSSTQNATYATNSVIKGSAGILYNVGVHNKSASTTYLMLFNLTALPANGTTPARVFTVLANTTVQVPMPARGATFSTGIVAALSTTEQTLTIAGTDGLFWSDFD